MGLFFKTAEARRFKFCTQVGHIDYINLVMDDKSP